MSRHGNKKQVMQIGDFAQRAGVSVRAIRYYEELGLIRPESHSNGGFRLYGHENLKRIRVINFLKDLGLSLTDIRQIFLAKKPSGGDKQTVEFLLRVFDEKLSLVEERLETLNKMKSELARAIKILHSCETCDHKILLDAMCCGSCSNLMPRESVPDTFEVILQ
jgi:DNA-binding transcriptional MerR regulator